MTDGSHRYRVESEAPTSPMVPFPRVKLLAHLIFGLGRSTGLAKTRQGGTSTAIYFGVSGRTRERLQFTMKCKVRIQINIIMKCIIQQDKSGIVES